MARQRPNLVQWVRYAYGRQLPDRYRDWVLYDSTTRTWLWRFALKIAVEALPFLVVGFVLLLVLSPAGVLAGIGAVALALAVSLYFTMTSADELVEARLVKHGFAPGTGKRVRRRRVETSPTAWPSWL